MICRQCSTAAGLWLLVLLGMLLGGCAEHPEGTTYDTVRIITKPTPAYIYLNGKYVGESPIDVEVWFGNKIRRNKVSAIPFYPRQSVQTVLFDAPVLPDRITFYMNQPKFAIDEKPKEEPLKLASIMFPLASAELTESVQKMLVDHADWLKAAKHRTVQVLIEGHCDERGSAILNYQLGLARAEAVMQALVAAGVSPERLVAVSRGKDDPAVQGRGEKVWQHNRRVDFILTKP